MRENMEARMIAHSEAQMVAKEAEMEKMCAVEHKVKEPVVE